MFQTKFVNWQQEEWSVFFSSNKQLHKKFLINKFQIYCLNELNIEFNQG